MLLSTKPTVIKQWFCHWKSGLFPTNLPAILHNCEHLKKACILAASNQTLPTYKAPSVALSYPKLNESPRLSSQWHLLEQTMSLCRPKINDIRTLLPKYALNVTHTDAKGIWRTCTSLICESTFSSARRTAVRPDKSTTNYILFLTFQVATEGY